MNADARRARQVGDADRPSCCLALSDQSRDCSYLPCGGDGDGEPARARRPEAGRPLANESCSERTESARLIH